MIIDHMRDPGRSLPTIESSADVVAMRIWHCGYRTLAPLVHYQRLATLIVATWPDDTFDVLGQLPGLRYLAVVHMPKVTSLEPLGSVLPLETVRLATLPSWDSSGKTTTVSSLAPLGRLPALRHVELFGVLPKYGSLDPLLRCPTLETVRISKYPDQQRRHFYETAEVTDDFAPRPPIKDW